MPRPTYSPSQITKFYHRINLPLEWRLESDSLATIALIQDQGLEALNFLSVLQRFTLAHIPFEDLSLHYERRKGVDLHPELLFKKIVVGDNEDVGGVGRGGYCMEVNAFFATVLRSLGFSVYSTGARTSSNVSPSGDVDGEDVEGLTGNEITPTTREFYFGFAHMLNIVTIQGIRYLVDVGFGAGCSTRPLPLLQSDDKGQVEEYLNIKPSQEVRLRYGPIEENECAEAKMWIYERRNRLGDTWKSMYCFPDRMEFLPADFVMMNYFTSTSPMVTFTHVVLVVRFILSDDGEDIVGEEVIVGGKYHKRLGGKKVEEIEMKSEDERVQILEERLGIRLDEHQQSGILGMISMLGQ